MDDKIIKISDGKETEITLKEFHKMMEDEEIYGRPQSILGFIWSNLWIITFILLMLFNQFNIIALHTAAIIATYMIIYIPIYGAYDKYKKRKERKRKFRGL